ncbi:MAG TPA: translation initiation factor IF-2 [Rhodobiaceae bacterium]|nr:MAG: Translation initiation factor IF-2 [Rhodobiaceae bacterium UBA7378]HCQ82399.1 translation initiation factor IF-2 [Rhodobiaceae bacterium]
MSDIKTGDDGEQSAGRSKTLSLKRTVESGQVRQSFSHGRSKSVLVEKRRKRTINSGTAEVAPAPEEVTPEAPAAPAAGENLSKSQQDRRQAAVVEAKQRAIEEAKQSEIDARRQAEEDARRAEEQAQKAAEEASRAEALAREKKKPVKQVADAAPAARPEAARRAEAEKQRQDAKKPSSERRGNERRRRAGKLTINDALNDEERVRSLASMRRRREREKRQTDGMENAEKVSRTVQLPDTISIQELANRMAERAVDVIKILMQQGVMAKINDVIDADTAQIVAEDLGHSVRRVSESDIEDGLIGDADKDEDMTGRPPVVTVMGHVDHGKTSLLDALRKEKVAAGEAGGITQHIGAYQTTTQKGVVISFIDTPGHAAFTAMRARGAKVTDIVILVVAADDGVMPQTVEAINHAKAAEAPIIVAINKMDKPEADPTRVKNELLQHEIISEDMGGETQMIEVSAQTGDGLENLLEAVALQSEVMELKANRERGGEGIVIEAKLDKGRGPVATVLVQRGTLRVGDVFVVGQVSGRVRALINDLGEPIDEAGPSAPVEVLGSNGVPGAGDVFSVVETEARAREVAEYRSRKARDKSSASGPRAASLDQMMKQLKDSDIAEVPLLVKGDVQGSVEAIAQAAEKLGTDEVAARVLLSGVGGITESDITLASASNAIVLGFNVRANAQARSAAEASGIEIRYYNVIYDLVDDLKAAMAGLLSPDLRETPLGTAEILEVFSVTKTGKVAGCQVREGLVRRGARVRLIRDDIVIHEGELSSLRRFKDEVKEVNAGQECGMAFENYSDLKQGDVIECYEVEEIARSLDG